MAEGITLKRIIDMDEAAELTSSDYALVDSATGGPKKFALGDELSSLKDDLSSVENNILTADIRQALLQIAEKVAYIDADGQDYYDDLYDALYPPVPPAELVSISAVYTQSGTVYDTDTLDSLKADLVVTATYSDQTTETVTTYTLSGTLTVGTCTITVSYGGKTATFDVVVVVNTVSMELGGLDTDGSEVESTNRLRTVDMIPIDLNAQEIVDNVAFDMFTVNASTGVLEANSARLGSQRIPVTGGQEFTATVADGYYLKAFVYGSDGKIKTTGIGDLTSKSISGTIPSNCAFVRLIAKHTDNSDMASGDIASLSLTVNGQNYNTVQGQIADLCISSTASINGSAGKFFLRGYDSNGLHVTNYNHLEDTLVNTDGTVKGFSGLLLDNAQIRICYRTANGTDGISSFSGSVTINGVEMQLSY